MWAADLAFGDTGAGRIWLDMSIKLLTGWMPAGNIVVAGLVPRGTLYSVKGMFMVRGCVAGGTLSITGACTIGGKVATGDCSAKFWGGSVITGAGAKERVTGADTAERLTAGGVVIGGKVLATE